MRPDTYSISLTNLRFHANHGVFPQETKVGNDFVVSVSVTLPFDDAIFLDDLEATISYADIYEIVAEEMNRPRKLLETVGAVIADRISEKWPKIQKGEVSICKSTPPIPGITGASEVKIFF